MVSSTHRYQFALAPQRSARLIVAWLVAGLLLAATSSRVYAEASTEASDPFETATEKAQAVETQKSTEATESSAIAASDPFEAQTAIYDPFESLSPVDSAAYF